MNFPEGPIVKLRSFAEKLPHNLSIIVPDNVMQLIPSTSELLTMSKYAERTLSRYRKNRRYPQSLLLKLDHFLDGQLISALHDNHIRCLSKWKIVALPTNLTPKLAYFVGYLQGDGCIESNKKRISFADEYESQIRLVNKISADLFGVGGLRSHDLSSTGRGAHRLALGSLAVNAYLHCVFGINRGLKQNLQIPDCIIKEKELLRWYLSGLFDADGTLPIHPSTCVQYFVDVTFKDKPFVLQIREALKTFGVETLPPKCRIAKSPSSETISRTWELQIRRKAHIITFLNEIGFVHPHKRERQKNLLALLTV